MNSNIIKNFVKSRFCNQELYTHTHAFSTADGVVSGDVVLRIGSD